MSRAYLIVVSTQNLCIEHGDNGHYYRSMRLASVSKGYPHALSPLGKRKRISAFEALVYVNDADLDCSNGTDRLVSIDDALVAKLRSEVA